MGKDNNFSVSDKKAREMEIQYLSQLYEHLAGPGNYRFAHGESGQVKALQKHGVDVQVCIGSSYLWFDDKIVQWPERGIPYNKFCLETLSCSIEGRETNGWMHEGRADGLTYGFEQKLSGLPIFLDTYVQHKFQKLKKWFWSQDLTRYPIHTEPKANKSRSVLMPITEVLNAFPDTERYFVFESCVIPVEKRENRIRPIAYFVDRLRSYLERKHPKIINLSAYREEAV